MDPQELEYTILKNLMVSAEAIERIRAAKIDSGFFTYITDDQKGKAKPVCYTAKLFELMMNYYDASGGYIMSEMVLGNSLAENNIAMVHRSRVMSLWKDIEAIKHNPNDLFYLIEELKARIKKIVMRSVFQEGPLLLSQKGVPGAQEYIHGVLDKLQEMDSDQVIGVQTIDVDRSKEFFETEVKSRRAMGTQQGIMLGMSTLDNLTQGLRPGQMLVAVAKSSAGKSTVMQNWACHAFHNDKKSVLYFSLEMDVWQCYLRHLAWYCGVPHKTLKGLEFSSDEQIEIIKKLHSLETEAAYFRYDYSPQDPTPDMIERKLRQAIRERGVKPDLMVVDYAGRLRSKNVSRAAAAWEKSGEASVELETIGGKYGVSIVTAQQLSKSSIGEQRKRKQDGKGVEFDQDMIAGDHRLTSNCAYVIAFDSDRVNNQMVFYPVKIREGGWFTPFGCQVDGACGRIKEFEAAEQEAFRTQQGFFSPQRSSKPGAENAPEETITTTTEGDFMVAWAGSAGTTFKQEDAIIDWDAGAL